MAGAVPRHVLLALVLAASPCRAEGEMPTPVTAPLPAGAYRLDPAHASLLFRADHLGMSRYTARFTRFDAELTLDPANPGAARLTATVDPLSLETDNRDPTYDFDATARPGLAERRPVPADHVPLDRGRAHRPGHGPPDR
jgi:polyisoprenoid-binding protein YceI